MKPGIPWSVKGIDQQARAAAKQAARQSGVTIGEWLNSVILESAEDGDDLERRFRRGPYRPKAPPHSGEGEGQEVHLRLEELAEQLHALTSQQNETALARLSAAAGTDPHDQGVVEAILARLDSYEQHTSSTLGAMQERLEDVSSRLGRLPEAAQTPAEVPGLPALEGAMRNIIEHIEVSDTRTRDGLKALHDRFERMEQIGADDAGAAVIARLEQSVAELSQRMGATDAAAHQHVDSEVARLRAEIDRLNQRFDDLKSESASEGDLNALRATVDGLAASGGPAATERLERQIAGLAERLTASEQRIDHMATIERSVEELVRSFDENRASTAAVAQTAAKRAAEQVLSNAGSHGAPSPELKAMEEGLKAVRASVELADRRTHETFAAVHETLEQIVRKLAEIEAGGEHAGPETAEAIDSADEGEALKGEGSEGEASEGEPVAENAAQLGDAETMPDAEESLTEDDQVSTAEDGDEVPSAEAAAEPEADAETSEPEMQFASFEIEAEAPDDPAPRDSAEMAGTPAREDFIAAARHAAQMASARNASGFNRFSQRMAGGRPQPIATAAGVDQKKRRFPFSAAASSRPRRADAGGEKPAASAPSKRKRLILAGLVLLVAVSAYGASRQAGLVPDTGALWPVPDVGQPPEPVSTAPVPQRQRQSDARALEPAATAGISALARSDLALAPPEIGPDSLARAAAQGDATAQFLVASLYLEGPPQQRDEAKAAQWYKRAAMQDLAPAQYRLGTLYERGRGVPRDRAAARLWYEEAAGSGNIRAMHNLAVLHADGNSGHTDYERAADWFRKAAERGLKDSQFNLAVLSAQGIGVPQNTEEALFWFFLSAAQGDKEAAVRASALEARLGEAKVASIKARLADWMALPSDQAANAVSVGDPSWYDASVGAGKVQAVASGAGPDAALSDTALIRRAQQLLSEQGYDIGDADGVMDDRTANAVRLFQMQQRLQVNGMVSRDLVRVLESRRL